MASQLTSNLLKEKSRLELQLAELEEAKADGDLDEDEYNEMKGDTETALEKINVTLGGSTDVSTDREKEEAKRRAETEATSGAKDFIGRIGERSLELLRKELATADDGRKRELVGAIKKAGGVLTAEEEGFLDMHQGMFGENVEDVDVGKLRLSES